MVCVHHVFTYLPNLFTYFGCLSTYPLCDKNRLETYDLIRVNSYVDSLYDVFDCNEPHFLSHNFYFKNLSFLFANLKKVLLVLIIYSDYT